MHPYRTPDPLPPPGFDSQPINPLRWVYLGAGAALTIVSVGAAILAHTLTPEPKPLLEPFGGITAQGTYYWPGEGLFARRCEEKARARDIPWHIVVRGSECVVIYEDHEMFMQYVGP